MLRQGDAQALALFVMSGGFDSASRKDSALANVMPSFRQLPDEDLAQILIDTAAVADYESPHFDVGRIS